MKCLVSQCLLTEEGSGYGYCHSHKCVTPGCKDERSSKYWCKLHDLGSGDAEISFDDNQKHPHFPTRGTQVASRMTIREYMATQIMAAWCSKHLDCSAERVDQACDDAIATADMLSRKLEKSE